MLERVPSFSGLQFSHLQNAEEVGEDLRGGFPSALNTLKGKTVVGMTCHNVGSTLWGPDSMWAPLPTWLLWAKALPIQLVLPSWTQHVKPSSYKAKRSEGKATILPDTQSPTMMFKEKRVCAGNLARSLAHQCLCRGIMSRESPFPLNAEYDPGEHVMRLLLRLDPPMGGYSNVSQLASTFSLKLLLYGRRSHRLVFLGGIEGHIPESLRAKE